MASISHLGKMARTSAKSENPIRPISGRMIVTDNQSSPKSLAQSTALDGSLSQYRVTMKTTQQSRLESERVC